MNSSPETACVACAGSRTKVFWSDENRTIRECDNCGLLFLFPQPDPTALHAEFQSAYFASSNGGGATRLELEFEEWRRGALARIVRSIRALRPAGRLLDVGCASGEIFEYFRDEDWQLYGVEPSTLAFARAHERFGSEPRVHLFNAYLGDASFEPKSFDVITVLESLYYMPDPCRELSDLRRIIKDDGLLAIAMPGYTYHRVRHSGPLSRVLYGTRCSLTRSHLFYFSTRSLAALLKRAGFRICEIVPLGSSAYGSSFGRLARQTYLTFSAALERMTFGQINLAPHVLYLCRTANS